MQLCCEFFVVAATAPNHNQVGFYPCSSVYPCSKGLLPAAALRSMLACASHPRLRDRRAPTSSWARASPRSPRDRRRQVDPPRRLKLAPVSGRMRVSSRAGRSARHRRRFRYRLAPPCASWRAAPGPGGGRRRLPRASHHRYRLGARRLRDGRRPPPRIARAGRAAVDIHGQHDHHCCSSATGSVAAPHAYGGIEGLAVKWAAPRAWRRIAEQRRRAESGRRARRASAPSPTSCAS